MKKQWKTVLVTGGSSGIGAACVEAFAGQGADVVINYLKDEKGAKDVATSASKHGVETLIVRADVARETEVKAMFAKIKAKFSSLDVLINNAGIHLEEATPEGVHAIRQEFETNFFGALHVTNAARRLMHKGKIVYVSSIHGKLGHGRPGVIGYAASKAALDSYMKNLAKALAPDILVNAIAPGRTLTPMWGELDEEYKAEMAAGQLINRWIEPSEIADGAVFLAKNDAVCGEVLIIDGGMSLRTIG
jgi:3-oxoacyl-[acyl-carrier protein] reductase